MTTYRATYNTTTKVGEMVQHMFEITHTNSLANDESIQKKMQTLHKKAHLNNQYICICMTRLYVVTKGKPASDNEGVCSNAG